MPEQGLFLFLGFLFSAVLTSKATGSCCATPEVLALAHTAAEMAQEEVDQINCFSPRLKPEMENDWFF